MFLPFRQVALVFALGASLIALPLESACAAEAAGKKAVLVPIKAGSTAAKARTAQTKNVKSKQASVKKVSIKTAAKNTRQAAAKKPKPKQKARRVVRRTGPSQATLAGLRQTDDPLQLGSSVAYAMDQDTGEELVVKNADVELPIASVTKLMTALVIAESDVDLDEKVRITREDYVRSTAHSKLISGMRLTRESLLKAALMSSDNRAAAIGMTNSFFADPTGLDNRNHSTARDLGKLVAAVYQHQEIRDASTTSMARISTGRRQVNLATTNRLIGDPSWRIGIQKTGFTTAAGRCMVVQSDVGERRLVMVVLDSPNNAQRADDMRTMRAYVQSESDFSRDFEHVAPYEIF